MNRLHGGAKDPGLLDFSANVNPLGPPDAVRGILERGLDLVRRYPSQDASDLCGAAAKHHGVPEESILAGNGASDLIYLVARAYRGQSARILVPAFTEYEDACLSERIPVNEGGESLTFLGNPTSPDGRLLSRQEIQGLEGTVVVDEAFMDFAGDRQSLVAEASGDPRLIVIRSLTKFFAIPGLRVGYLVAHPETVRRLRVHQPPWSVNALAEAAALASFLDQEYAEFSRRFVAERRTELTEGLLEFGLEVWPSVACYLLLRVPDAELLCRELLGRGIAVRNCDSFTGLEKNRFVRVAVRKRSENERLLGALREIFEKCAAKP